MLFSRMRFRSAVVSRQSPRPALVEARRCGPSARFSRIVVDVPVAVPVEQVLIRADQERAGAAGRVETIAELAPACLRGVLPSSSLPTVCWTM